jgi:hypothetical protein
VKDLTGSSDIVPIAQSTAIPPISTSNLDGLSAAHTVNLQRRRLLSANANATIQSANDGLSGEDSAELEKAVDQKKAMEHPEEAPSTPAADTTLDSRKKEIEAVSKACHSAAYDAFTMETQLNDGNLDVARKTHTSDISENNQVLANELNLIKEKREEATNFLNNELSIIAQLRSMIREVNAQELLKPVDCHWSEWANWTKCSAKCGGGKQSRVRHMAVIGNDYGEPCMGPPKEIRTCNAQPCPIDCEWGAWGAWSQCSASCGPGTFSRNRHKAINASHGGKKCQGESEESHACTLKPCPVNCVMTSFGNWSKCSAGCGKGQMHRERAVQVNAAHGGAKCPSKDTFLEKASCDAPQQCPETCVTGMWSAWSKCSSACGPGTRSRTRKLTAGKQGEKGCNPELKETEPCNAGLCSSDCVMGDWGQCSAHCGYGVQTRVVEMPPTGDGRACPEQLERTCRVRDCGSSNNGKDKKEKS